MEAREISDTISVEDLIRLCEKYDKSNGEWPESRYEGYSVLRLILGKVTGTDEYDPEVDRVIQKALKDRDWADGK